MVVSAIQVAKRALLVVMRAVAPSFATPMTCNRDSPDADILAAFRILSRRAHPDGGGSNEQQQQLNDARAAWDTARKKKTTSGSVPWKPGASL